MHNFPILWEYCQAQPQLKPKLNLAEVALNSISGCHNPRPRGHIVDRKFALSHRKFQLISMRLILSRVK